MDQYILKLFEHQGDLTWQQVVGHVGVSAVLGALIFISYYLSHRGTIYSRKFNITLIALTVLTGTVMTVIGNNVALSLGMVGALSIVRFRTAVKDSRDTAYIFWTIIVGICCGVGDYLVACVGSCAVFLVFLLFGCIKNDNRMLLILRGARNGESKMEALVYRFFRGKAVLRVKNTTEDSIELIYEISAKSLKKASAQGTSVTDSFYAIENMEYVQIVMQNDEIGS